MVFAYPNGNHTAFADGVARELGYVIRVLFDHRIARSGMGDRPLSRLRVASDAELGRMRAIASGAHALAFTVGRR